MEQNFDLLWAYGRRCHTQSRRGGVPTLQGSGRYLDLRTWGMRSRRLNRPGNGGPWEWRALGLAETGFPRSWCLYVKPDLKLCGIPAVSTISPTCALCTIVIIFSQKEWQDPARPVHRSGPARPAYLFCISGPARANRIICQSYSRTTRRVEEISQITEDNWPNFKIHHSSAGKKMTIKLIANALHVRLAVLEIKLFTEDNWLNFKILY